MKTAFIKLFKTEKDATKTSHKLCSTKTAKKTAPHATVESCSCSIRKKKPLLNVYRYSSAFINLRPEALVPVAFRGVHCEFQYLIGL
jgi:hypothetical protein